MMSQRLLSLCRLRPARTPLPATFSRRHASTTATASAVTPPPKEMIDDGKTPQYFGSFKESGIDPQIGDYPNLKWVNAQDKDPYGNYWDVDDRRNKGEPLHYQDEVISVWGPDVHDYPAGKATKELLTFFAVLGGVAFAAIKYDAQSNNPAAPRVYPYDGLKEELGGDHVKTHARSADA
ncbi:hypothetical protein BKA69DRAFT_1068559 [Paraphysoderma sedebokerense]|nr:hypothetical protein BKA69DRAFT_1068559 [Paraphysoderma sedebokerense]